jgi:Na+/melibiose symporter-like transporter
MTQFGTTVNEAGVVIGQNRYDSLYLIMMVMGYVFSAPFFLLTVRTSQKYGQKKSLMTYVAVAFACYIGVLVMLLLWREGDPAWNLSIFDGALFGPDFKITINAYTVFFVLFFGVGYGAYYATADMPIPMVADCADYETYRSGKFIPGIMGTLFSLVDKLVSSLSATVVSIALLFIGIDELPTKATLYADGMNWVVIVLFCLIPMTAWALTIWAMKGYSLDGARIKTIQAVNAARKAAVENGMSMEDAMVQITDETVGV